MKKIITTIAMICSVAHACMAQEESFKVQISRDTLLAGNYIELTFIADQISGKFQAPDLNNFDLISGPNTSTSMQMINREFSQRSSYSFILKAKHAGEFPITPAYLYSGEQIYETLPLIVVVLENPDGIIEDFPESSGRSNLLTPPSIREKNKKKAKRKKI